METHVLGPEPAREAAVAALDVLDGTVTTHDSVAELEQNARRAELGVVVGSVDDDRFARANASFGRLIAATLGGFGGCSFSDVSAAIAAFTPETGCYDCLCRRVAAATADAEQNAADTPSRRGETADRPSDGTEPDTSLLRYVGAVAGRRAVELARGEPVAGVVAELDGPRRPFTRTPGCDCHEPPSGFERGGEQLSLDASVERMERAVDERVGLVTEVGERESFPVPYYVARTADTTTFSDVRCGEFGGGAAVNWNEAYAKSVGEALERYCAGTYRERRLRHAPTDGVIDGVPVERFVRPDDAPDVTDERLAWIDGVELETGAYAALPASFVVFPPPRRLAPPITTGLGAGTAIDQAVRSGLTEVIERDATMLAWYSTFEPMELVVETDRYAALEKRARAEGLSATALLCTQDVDVPVVACAVHRDGEWPRFAAGSAAGVDAERTAADALAEALQNWTELRGMGRARATQEGGAIGRYADLPPKAEAFVDAPTRLPASEVSLETDQPLDALVDRVTAAGLTPYAARLTTSDAAELGFEVVRVLVPEAQPLFTGEAFFGGRLETVPPELGFEPRPDRAYHPYP